MDARLKDLCAAGPGLTDGAWGTELQGRGLPLGESADAWNVTNPNPVAEVARAYVEAGSQVILTNTFGANRIALSRFGLAQEIASINMAGAEISRQAAGSGVRVFGSMGPTGKSITRGELTPGKAFSVFEEQAAVLAEHVDGLVVETMTDIREARLAVLAAAATGLPVVACMHFGRAITDQTIRESAEMLSAAGATALGSNCGFGPRAMLPICRSLRAATDLPLWIKPNAGLPDMVNGRPAYGRSPREFAEDAVSLVLAGADFVGGCCGSGPDHIRALATALGLNRRLSHGSPP